MSEKNGNEYTCNLVFCKEYRKNEEEILKFLRTNENFRIITDSQNIKNLADQNNISCKAFDEIIPNENDEKIVRIYEESKKNIEIYGQIFDKMSISGKEIFQVIRYFLLRQFMQLYRIKKILSDENNTVFLFEGFLPIYQVIPEILEKMNYKLKDVFLISNKIRKTK